MASLYEALECLQPTSWDEVPHSPEELREYVRDIFKKSRLVAESIPNPPPYEHDEYPGGDFGTAQSTTRVVPSSARVAESDPQITSMQKQWGKPIKMGGHKENPLGVHVYKLSTGDGSGQWFGRRSVHEGLPFTQWRKKLSTEIPETLSVNRKKIENGETPDKSIRGIGAEEKVEAVEVKDEDGAELGQVMVYHLLAQFPKPTTPRDFVALIITSDLGLQVGGTTQPGRSWMMVSKPCEHTSVPEKHGYIRGEYESIELIREIPVRKNGQGSGDLTQDPTLESQNGPAFANAQLPDEAAESGALEDEDDEMNPVEWIMVTRSDPGGSIPRWIVDKGTPKSVGTDAAKFVKWAVQEDLAGQDGQLSQAGSIQGSETPTKPGESDGQRSSRDNDSESESDSTDSDFRDAPPGLIASVTGLINSGLERFAPQSILDYIPHHQEQPRHIPGDIQVPQSTSDSSTSSNLKGHIPSDPGERQPDRGSLSSVPSETPTPGLGEITHQNVFPSEAVQTNKSSKITQYEKELAKLASRKREVEAKLDRVRAELDNLYLPVQNNNNNTSTPSKGVTEAKESDGSAMIQGAAGNRPSTPGSSSTHQSRQRDGKSSESHSPVPPPPDTPTAEGPTHVNKAASRLFHDESKLVKQLRKIEGSQLKVASKIEVRQRKQTERDKKMRSRSEVDGLRREVDELKKEVASLRSERQKWVDLVSALQAENTKLAAEKENKS